MSRITIVDYYKLTRPEKDTYLRRYFNGHMSTFSDLPHPGWPDADGRLAVSADEFSHNQDWRLLPIDINDYNIVIKAQP